MLLSNYQPVARGSRKATPFALILAPTRELTSQVRTIVWEQVWIAQRSAAMQALGKGQGAVVDLRRFAWMMYEHNQVAFSFCPCADLAKAVVFSC